MAIGKIRCDACKPANFETFLSTAACATLPIVQALTAIQEGVNVSTMVVSQVKQRTPYQDTSVSPSGPPPGANQMAFFIDKVSALRRRAHQTRSLICYYYYYYYFQILYLVFLGEMVCVDPWKIVRDRQFVFLIALNNKEHNL